MSLEQISLTLGLVGPDGYPQDWGICNADGTRAEEFLAFYGRAERAGGIHMELADLVLGSFFEAAVHGDVPPRHSEDLRHFLRCCWATWPMSLEYWLRYASSGGDEHGFSHWLKSAVAASGEHMACGPMLSFWVALHGWMQFWDLRGQGARRVAMSALQENARRLRDTARDLPSEWESPEEWPLSLNDSTWWRIFEMGQSLFDENVDFHILAAGEKLPERYLYLNLADAAADVDAELRAGLKALQQDALPRQVYAGWRTGFELHWGSHIDELIEGIEWRLRRTVDDAWGQSGGDRE